MCENSGLGKEWTCLVEGQDGALFP